MHDEFLVLLPRCNTVVRDRMEYFAVYFSLRPKSALCNRIIDKIIHCEQQMRPKRSSRIYRTQVLEIHADRHRDLELAKSNTLNRVAQSSVAGTTLRAATAASSSLVASGLTRPGVRRLVIRLSIL